MEGHFLPGQSPQWAVVPMEEEEEGKEEEILKIGRINLKKTGRKPGLTAPQFSAKLN